MVHADDTMTHADNDTKTQQHNNTCADNDTRHNDTIIHVQIMTQDTMTHADNVSLSGTHCRRALQFYSATDCTVSLKCFLCILCICVTDICSFYSVLDCTVGLK